MKAYELLEKKWAEWNDLDPANMVACASGTAALHLAVECICQPQLGKDVILSDYNMIACARAVTLGGQKPIFVDCNHKLTINPNEVKKNVTINTLAILATHVYGRRCDMAAITSHGIPVIEDCAEAHGIHIHVNTDAACWSFYRNKIVAGEEGGAVYFKDYRMAQWAKQLRCLGFTEEHNFLHRPRGHNYRLSNIHAELILDSLKTATANIAARETVIQFFDEALPPEWRQPRRGAPWVYDIRIPGMSFKTQGALVAALSKYEVRYGFKPMTMQPEYESTSHTHAFKAASEIIYFPITPSMSRNYVQQAVEDLLRHCATLRIPTFP